MISETTATTSENETKYLEKQHSEVNSIAENLEICSNVKYAIIPVEQQTMAAANTVKLTKSPLEINEETEKLISKYEYTKAVEMIYKIKKENANNYLAIGKVLVCFKKAYSKIASEKYFRKFLKDKRVGIGRTQAEKMMAVYKYCLRNSENCQSTETYLKLGIEKIFLISQLNNEENQYQLEQYTLKYKLNVKQIKYMVGLLNKEIQSDISLAYNEAWSAKKQKRLDTEIAKIYDLKPKVKTVKEDKYNELQDKYFKLEKECYELKKRLKEYEDSNQKTENTDNNKPRMNLQMLRKQMLGNK